MKKTITETESPVPTNAMGTSSSTAGTGAIDTYDPIMNSGKIEKRKLLRDVIKKSVRKEVK